MSHKSLLDKTVFAVAFVGIIILVNTLGLNAFWRLDLTEDGQYTLSDASRDAVADLEDRLTIKAYFTEGLPAPYSNNSRYVRDLLEEYYSASGGELSYEFLDPLSEETEADKEKRKEVRQDIFGRNIREETDVERELRSLGIAPVEVRVNEGDSLEVKRVYMGISLRYGDQKEVIPVVTDVAKLEYDLTTLIRKVTRTRVPKIGLVTGREGLDQRTQLSTFTAILSQQYELTEVDLTADATIPDDVDALIVTGPEQPFESTEVEAIEAFVASGKAAAFLPDAVRVDLRTTEYTELDHGLAPLLARWGVRIEPGLVLDAQCAQINVTQQRGFMRIAQPVQYPFMPVALRLDQEHPLTRGLAEVAFPFSSALSLEVDEASGIESDVIVSSSENSWVQALPIDLNPLQRWPDTIQFDGPHPVVVALAGPLGGPGEGDEAAANGRVLVFGGSSVIQDQFLSGTGQALVLNLVDWLLLDDAMLDIRTRGLVAAPLEEVSDSKRATLKYFNIIGIPLIFVAIGLVRWRLRERRRALVTV